MDDELKGIVIIFCLIIGACTIFFTIFQINENDKTEMFKCLEVCNDKTETPNMIQCQKGCELLRNEINMTSDANNTYIHGYFTNEFIKEIK